jgi:hypothetical protein
MHEWVCSRLDDIVERTEWRGSHVNELYENALEAADPLDEGEAVRSADEYADLEPLRKMFPNHAKYINPRKLTGRGKRPKRKTKDRLPLGDPWHPRLRLAMAVEEAGLIRAIWREHYEHSKRPKGQLRATEIAAARWDLAEEEVIKKRLSLERLKTLARPE